MGDYRPKIEERIVKQLARISALLLVALFQTALAPSLWRFRVDWMLIVVVSWTLLSGVTAGLRWAIIGGLALDFLSPLPVGSHLLALLLAVIVAALITEGLPRGHGVVPTATVLLVSLLYGAVLALVMSLDGRPVVWARYPLTILLPGALANGAIALPVYLLLERLHRGDRPDIALET